MSRRVSFQELYAIRATSSKSQQSLTHSSTHKSGNRYRYIAWRLGNLAINPQQSLRCSTQKDLAAEQQSSAEPWKISLSDSISLSEESIWVYLIFSSHTEYTGWKIFLVWVVTIPIKCRGISHFNSQPTTLQPTECVQINSMSQNMNTLTFSKLFHIKAVPSSARWPIQRLSSGGELLRHLWLVAAASSQQYGSGVLVTKGVGILPPHLRS